MTQIILTLIEAQAVIVLPMPDGMALRPAALIDGSFALPADVLTAGLPDEVIAFLTDKPKRAVDFDNEATLDAFNAAVQLGWNPHG